MGTWISHLRIAENILRVCPNLDETAFTFGSLAPDSGLPNADWTQFDPPKELSHFLPEGSGEGGAQDLVFYRKYVKTADRDENPALYSFLIGYFVHLASDHLWSDKVGKASRQVYASLFENDSEVKAWDTIKEDWYALDQRYVRDVHDCLFWRVFLNAPIPQSPLPFVRQEAFEHQVNYIRDFYSHPSDEWVLDRPYPYLNEAHMNRYIEEASASLVKSLRLLSALPAPEGLTSITSLLTSSETSAFTPPLGDVE